MSARRVLLVLLTLAWLLCGTGARADTPVSLFQAFRGQVNFTGTEQTLRMKDNKQPCHLVNANQGIAATLQGIPSGATILSAQLYWAGSGNTPIYTVTLDGVTLSAPTERRYTSATIGSGMNYFSGAVDVTNQVALKGNGSYNFSGLKVDNGDPWCSAQGVLGGFALLVVYSHPGEPYRMLNLYDGFQYFRSNGLTLTLNNFAVPDPLPATSTGRIGHVTWEGDATASGGEDLLFNGYEMTDSINPSGNQFNSASNVTGDTTSYGIDFDAYTIKAPVIQAGQTTATTTYRTGQDMVLLGAQVVALPYVPGADLLLSMTRAGSLQVGSSTDYQINVSNIGNDTETGPVTVVDTLPPGLCLVAARGSGWSCANALNASGQTIVTCTGAGPVPGKTAMNTLVLTVSPTAAGNYTNSATVSGKSTDINPNNNAASDAASATDPNAGTTAGTLVFTTRACNVNEAIGANGCPSFAGSVTAGAGQIFITNVSKGSQGLVAAAVSTQDKTLSAQLTLSCAPSAGVTASYAGVTLACGGAAQTAQLLFQANKPTALLPAGTPLAAFTYYDVGQLALTLSYNGSSTSQPFVSRPASVVLYKVLRASDGYPDLNDKVNPPDIAFVKAGEDFVMQLAATMANTNSYAPSFGREATLPAVTLNINSPTGKAVALAITDNFSSSAQDKATGAGLLIGKAQWYEAGLLTLTPGLSDYLASGAPVSGSARTIGRFYPDHYTTELPAPFDCLPAMACTLADPVKPVYGVGGAMYSGQPVTATMRAFSLPRPGTAQAAMTLYQNPAGSKRSIVLSAVSAVNAATAPAGGSLALLQPLPTSTTDVPYPALVTQLTYTLPVPYDPAKPRAGNWSAPLPVYLRASATDTRYVKDANGNDTAQDFTISSISAASGTAGAPQFERGLNVVDGRVLVGNVFGSELSRVPLPLTAQYWTGSAWQTNSKDNDSVVATRLQFSNCTRSFAVAGKCQLPVLAVSAVPANGGAGLQLANGVGRLTLQAPPRGQNGSIDIGVINDASTSSGTANPAAATWLPGTTGRASFGLFRSPLIYLREVY